jgi:ribonuclease Z
MRHTREPETGRPGPLGAGHPSRRRKTWRTPGTGLDPVGRSRANDKTFFRVPGPRCAPDPGPCEGRRADTAFLTRARHDHAKDLGFPAAGPGTDIRLSATALPYADPRSRASAGPDHAHPESALPERHQRGDTAHGGPGRAG